MRHSDAHGCVCVCVWEGGIANDFLKMRKVMEFQSSLIVVYYKIHFCVLLQPICTGQASVVIVIEKLYNLVSSSKGNTMVTTNKT